MTGSHTTSWTLVFAAAGRDPLRRDEFSIHYGPVIRGYLAARWRVPLDHEWVEDGAQEVFLQCFKPGGALGQVDPSRSGGFRAFLYGVATNVALKQDRGRSRQLDRSTGGEESPGDTADLDSDSLSRVFDAEWARMITGEAMARLDERSATDASLRQALRVLELRFFDGLPPRAIARQLRGLDARRVSKLLETGLRRFHGALVDVMADYNPDATRVEVEQKCRDLLSLL